MSSGDADPSGGGDCGGVGAMRPSVGDGSKTQKLDRRIEGSRATFRGTMGSQSSKVGRPSYLNHWDQQLLDLFSHMEGRSSKNLSS